MIVPLISVISSLACAVLCAAQDVATLESPDPARPLALPKGPISVDFLGTLDLSAASGGVSSPKSGAYLLDLSVSADLGALDLLQGGLVFADLQYYNWFGDNPSGVGDYGVRDVIDPVLGDEMFQLSELWWQQALGGGFSTIVGKIDANRFFATVANAGPFLSVADAMPVTMFGYMPTYPNPAMGLMVQWSSAEDLAASPHGGWSAQFGVFDGTNMAYDPATGANGPRTGSRGPGTLFDGHWGPYLILEGGPTWRCGESESAWVGSAVGGGWLQTGQTILSTDAGSTIVNDAAGGYITLNQQLHSPSDEGTRFDVWAQFGFSNPNQSPAQFSAAAGTVCHALLPGRSQDSAGFMVSFVQMSDNADVYVAPSGDSGGNETLLELFYRIDLGNNVVLQPDIQYIFNPGGGSPASTEDALIGTLRIEIGF